MEILCSGQAYFCENSHVSFPMISTAASQGKDGFQAVCQAGTNPLFNHQSVYYDFNGMLLVFVQRDGF